MVLEQGDRGLNNGLVGLSQILIVLAEAPINSDFFASTCRVFKSCLILEK